MSQDKEITPQDVKSTPIPNREQGILLLKDLHKSFGAKVVHRGVSLELKRGKSSAFSEVPAAEKALFFDLLSDLKNRIREAFGLKART